MDLNQLTKDIHKTACAKGWWDENIINIPDCPKIIPRSIGDQFSNFHAEISEAWEEYRNFEQYSNKDNETALKKVALERIEAVLKFAEHK